MSDALLALGVTAGILVPVGVLVFCIYLLEVKRIIWPVCVFVVSVLYGIIYTAIDQGILL